MAVPAEGALGIEGVGVRGAAHHPFTHTAQETPTERDQMSAVPRGRDAGPYKYDGATALPFSSSFPPSAPSSESWP